MWFSFVRSVAKIVLLALFIACLGLYATSGQASAHSSWESGCYSHGDQGCYGDEHANDVFDNCDARDPNTGYCTHWRLNIPKDQTSDNCDAWDPNTGYCTHWRLNFSN